MLMSCPVFDNSSKVPVSAMEGSDYLNMAPGSWMTHPYMYSVPQQIPVTLGSSTLSRNSSTSVGMDNVSTSGSSGITYSAPTTPHDDVATQGATISYFDPMSTTAIYNQSVNHHEQLLRSHFPQPPGLTKGTMKSPAANGTSKYRYICDEHNLNQDKMHRKDTSPQLACSFSTAMASSTSQCSSLDSILLGPDSLQSHMAWGTNSADTIDGVVQSTARIPSSLPSSFTCTSWGEDLTQHNSHHITVNPSDTLSTFDQTQLPYLDSSQYMEGYNPILEDSSAVDMDASSFLESPIAVDFGDGSSSIPVDGREESPDRSLSPPITRTRTLGSNAVTKRRSPGAKKRAKSIARKHTFVQGLGWVAAEPARNDRIPCSFNCGQKFNRREHCTRHEKMHTNERPYICSLALNSGSDWCKIQEEKNDSAGSRKKKSKGIGRSDNQFQHYVTHLKWRHEGRKTRNNKCADKTFLYWIIWRHEGQRAYRVFDMVEAQMKKHDTPLGEPNYELMTKHPEWPDYVAWRESGGTLASLGYDGVLQE